MKSSFINDHIVFVTKSLLETNPFNYLSSKDTNSALAMSSSGKKFRKIQKMSNNSGKNLIYLIITIMKHISLKHFKYI